MAMPSDPQAALRQFPKQNEFFVGIDSDGCAFDTMEVKHKECFIPNIIMSYDLAAISKYAREAAEFVNLYSQWRGINRFPALVMTFDLLDRPARGPPPAPRHPRLGGLTSLDRARDQALQPDSQGRGGRDRRCRPGTGPCLERGGEPDHRRDGP